MIRPDYLMGTKNEAFGPGGIQNAVVETLVRTEGPIDAKLIDKNINDNGTYSASAEGADGFKKVVVDVPNIYTAGDEGKVVDNGELVAQTARAESITANGTYDTTNNNSVTVDVVGENNAKFVQKPGSYIFVPANCLESITIPNGCTNIQSNSFADYINLKNVDCNQVDSIGGNAFIRCTALETIIIHGAEGSVAGAPWGAPNATVTWTG